MSQLNRDVLNAMKKAKCSDSVIAHIENRLECNRVALGNAREDKNDAKQMTYAACVVELIKMAHVLGDSSVMRESDKRNTKKTNEEEMRALNCFPLSDVVNSFMRKLERN